MSPVLTRPRPRSGPVLVRRDVVIMVLAGAIAITILVGLHAALRGPQLVDRVTVSNRTPFLVDIEATSDTRDGWLKLGPVSPGETHSFGSVVDQGDHWIFHVTTGPYDGGEFSVTKTELERARWRVAIPDDVQQRLDSKGAVPLPRR
jgi:hypothetical protein